MIRVTFQSLEPEVLSPFLHSLIYKSNMLYSAYATITPDPNGFIRFRQNDVVFAQTNFRLGKATNIILHDNVNPESVAAVDYIRYGSIFPHLSFRI